MLEGNTMSQCRVPILQYTNCSCDRPGYILDLSSESSCKGIVPLSERLILGSEGGRCGTDQGDNEGKVIPQGHTKE